MNRSSVARTEKMTTKVTLTMPSKRCDESCCDAIAALKEENALLRCVLDALKTDLKIDDDRIENLYQSLRKSRQSSSNNSASSSTSVSTVSSPLPSSFKQRNHCCSPVFSLGNPVVVKVGTTSNDIKTKSLDHIEDDALLLIFVFLPIQQNLIIRRVCKRFLMLSKSALDLYWREALQVVKGSKTIPKRSVLSSSLYWKHELKWRGASEKPVVTTLPGHKGAPTCLSFASLNSRKFLVSGSDDGSLIVWSLNGDKRYHNLEHGMDNDDDESIPTPLSLSRSSSSTTTTTTPIESRPVIMQQHHRQSKNGTISRLHSLTGHHGPVFGVSVDDSLVCSGSSDQTVKVWQLSTGNCLHTLRGHTNWVSCVSLKDRTIVSGSWDSSVRIWGIQDDIPRFQGVLPVTEGGGAIHAIDRVGTLLAAGSDSTRFEVFDLERRQLIRSFPGAHKAKTYAVKFQTADVLATGGCDGKAKVWDLRQGDSSPVAVLTGHSRAVFGVQMGDAITTPYRVATGSGDHLIKIFDLRMFNVEGGVNEDDDVGRWISPCSRKSSTTTTSTKPIAGVATLSAHSEAVFTICMDETKLYSGSADGLIRVFRF